MCKFFKNKIKLDFYNVVRIFCDFSPHPSITPPSTIHSIGKYGNNRKYLHSLKINLNFKHEMRKKYKNCVNLKKYMPCVWCESHIELSSIVSQIQMNIHIAP